MIKTITRKGLIKKLDRLFSLKVREKGYCELKGLDNVRCGGVLQCAHIVGRGRHVIRWDLNNALCICAGHHVYYTHNPESWNELMKHNFFSKYSWVDGLKDHPWDKDLEKIQEQLST